MEEEPSYPGPKTGLAVDMLVITLLWCVSILLISPLGNFPLNDDWSYGLAVKNLVEQGDFRPTGWTSMPLITQVLWGSLFCIPGGFSFSALRLATLSLSLLGILGLYMLMRHLRQPRRLAVIAAMALGFNPVYYALSNTFMTDVPYTAVTVIASVFFVRCLKSDSNVDLAIGTALTLAATLTRQVAITLAVAFALSLILRRGAAVRNMLRAALPPGICIIALLAFQRWLEATGRLPALYHVRTDSVLRFLTTPGELVPFFVCNSYVILLHLGIWLLPVLIFVAASIWRHDRKKAMVALASAVGAVAVLSAVRAAHYGRELLMPFSDPGSIMVESGIGPLTLRDTFMLNLDHVPALPAGFWLAVTAVCMLGAALLAMSVAIAAIALAARFRPARMNEAEASGAFLLIGAALYLAPLLGSGLFFDRYFLPAAPLIAAGIASAFSRLPQVNPGLCRAPAVALVVAFALFSICGTRDYLAWNRIRWEALDDLMTSNGIREEEIDGGFEFNGLHLYDVRYQPARGKSWWWVHRDTYLISFGSLRGYTVIRKYDWPRWMPPHTGQVLVLRRGPRRALRR
jgi:hypothetical protein